MRFDGKIVIVTGAGSGIGKRCAEMFAAEGALVVAVDRALERLEETVAAIRSSGHDAVAVRADVSKNDEVRAMVQQVIRDHKQIDVLHNHAGILSARDASILDIEEEAIDETLSNNVKSQMLVAKYVASEMAKNKRGAIVNTASDLSFIALAGVCGYVTSKAAILGLTRAMAVDLAPYNIRVNAVCPGFVYDTGMTAGLAANEAVMNEMKKSYLIPRLGRPADIAPSVLHLASEDSGFTTGAFLVIDGGHTVW